MDIASFNEALRNVGVSEEAINLLAENEFSELPQLSGLDLEDFLRIGIKGNSARVLAEQFGRRAVEQASAQAAQPLKVEVTLPKSIEQMSITELLQFLGSEPGNKEVLAILLAKPDVSVASAKTDSWALPALENAAGMDIEGTLAYINYLGKSGSVPQRVYRGRRPKSIYVILGIVEKTMVNPFFDELLVEGLDSLGNDWSAVDRVLMKAIIWARATKHRFLPATIDPFSVFEEISGVTLPKRWQAILDDYSAALEEDDPVALGISLTAKSVKSAKPEFATSIVEELPAKKNDPEMLVRTKSLGNGDISGVNGVLTGVFDTIDVSGVGGRVDVVVIRRACVSGVNLTGSLRLAPGAKLDSSGVNNTIATKRLSWEQLSEIVKDW